MATKKPTRDVMMREMFGFPDSELPMKTNTPASKMESFVLMEVIEYGLSRRGMPKVRYDGDGNEIESSRPRKRMLLSQVYRMAHDRRMISLRGKGRDQAYTAMATQASSNPLDEFNMRRT